MRAAFGLETLKPPMGLYDLGPHRDKEVVENYFSYGLMADRTDAVTGAVFEAHLLIYLMWIGGKLRNKFAHGDPKRVPSCQS